MKPRTARILSVAALLALLPSAFADDAPAAKDKQVVADEHNMIGAAEDKNNAAHNMNPDAQWYPHAGLGLLLHWGVASVRAMNISWPMIPGRALAKKKLSPDELARVLKDHDYNLDGKPPEITPNDYWSQAKDFNPQDYDPEKWCKAAKDAGFEYVVLTTKHHEGFSLWPTAFGDFNTKNYVGGKDLLKPFVEACRHNDLKVGFYFSGPDWYFDKEYMSFLYGGGRKMNPDFPSLDADLNPRTDKKTPEEIKAHQEKFAALVKGEIEELLTHYGKIDLIWFDGKPNIPNAASVISEERIRELQPGIVMNGRLTGHGDFYTYERTMPKTKTVPGWAELCNPWNGTWPYTKAPYRSDAYVLSELAQCRAIGINYLLGIGPMASGDLAPEAYQHMAHLAAWMKSNGPAVHDVQPLSAGESCSVKATAAANLRYLYALPTMTGMKDEDIQPPTDTTLTWTGKSPVKSVTLLGDAQPLQYKSDGNTLTIQLPASRRTKLVDVIKLELGQ